MWEVQFALLGICGTDGPGSEGGSSVPELSKAESCANLELYSLGSKALIPQKREQP